MSALSIHDGNRSGHDRLNHNRLGRGFGLFVTVAVHGVAALLLLAGREQIVVEAPPITARLISEQSEPAPTYQPTTVRPALSVPQIHAALPEIVVEPSVAKSAPVAAAPAAASARTVVTSEVAAIVEPRFDADYLKNPAPGYPRKSRRQREEGLVVLRVFVSPAGMPEQIELSTSSGFAQLDDAALDAVRQWKFVPAQTAGKTIAAWVLVPIEFSLSTG